MARISLLVATIRRLAPLERLFASLAEQTYKDFEVIIADQNPPGFLDGLLKHYTALNVTAFVAPHGVSAARNAALERTQSPIVGFPDDDCWYEPRTLAAVAQAFDALPQCGGHVGISPVWLKHNTGWDVRGGPLNRWSIFRRTPTWAYFMRREVVEHVGGFDTVLGPGPGAAYACGEDTDLLIRALKAGFSICRNPDIHVHHPEPDFYTESASNKAYAYGRGRGYLLRKHKYGLGFKVINCLQPAVELLRPMQDKRRRAYHLAMLRGRLHGLLKAK